MDTKTTILDSIDNITNVVNESSVDVLDALIGSYDKADLILENYDGDDISAFGIFQEGKVLDEVKEKGKNDSAIKKILFFIPRLVTSLFSQLSKTSADAGSVEGLNGKLPADGIKKSKKNPNFFKRVMKSKPVKFITFVGLATGIAELSNTIKSSVKNIKDMKEESVELENETMNGKRNLAVNRPVYNISVQDDQYVINSSINIKRLENLITRYMVEVFSLIKAATNNIRSCDTLIESKRHMVKLASSIGKNVMIYEAFYDEESLKTAVPYDEFNKALSVCHRDFKSKQSYLKDQMTKELEALFEALQVDSHKKGIKNMAYNTALEKAAQQAEADDDKKKDAKTDESPKEKGDISATVAEFQTIANTCVNTIVFTDVRFALDTIGSIGRELKSVKAAMESHKDDTNETETESSDDKK